MIPAALPKPSSSTSGTPHELPIPLLWSSLKKLLLAPLKLRSTDGACAAAAAGTCSSDVEAATAFPSKWNAAAAASQAIFLAKPRSARLWTSDPCTAAPATTGTLPTKPRIVAAAADGMRATLLPFASGRSSDDDRAAESSEFIMSEKNAPPW